MWLIDKIGPALFDGFGGVQTNAIRDVFDFYDVPKADRPFYFEKIMIFCSERMKKDEPIGGKHGQQSRIIHHRGRSSFGDTKGIGPKF